MAIGMTYEQYWYGDPLMVRAFYKANKLRREREDEIAWTNGLYVLNALNAAVGNMFRKSGQEPAEYPKEPFTVSKRKEKNPKTETESEQEAIWAQAWMSSFVQAGQNWGKKG